MTKVITKKPIIGDTSPVIDLLTVQITNAFRETCSSVEDALLREHKMKRLDALLNDPALLTTYPKDHSERRAAVNRHIDLWYERKRYQAEATDAAKDTARLWDKLPDVSWKDVLLHHLAWVWHVSPTLSMTMIDDSVRRLPLWRAITRQRADVERKARVECPF